MILILIVGRSFKSVEHSDYKFCLKFCIFSFMIFILMMPDTVCVLFKSYPMLLGNLT